MYTFTLHSSADTPLLSPLFYPPTKTAQKFQCCQQKAADSTIPNYARYEHFDRNKNLQKNLKPFKKYLR
jgi:hypothetical protein